MESRVNPILMAMAHQLESGLSLCCPYLWQRVWEHLPYIGRHSKKNMLKMPNNKERCKSRKLSPRVHFLITHSRAHPRSVATKPKPTATPGRHPVIAMPMEAQTLSSLDGTGVGQKSSGPFVSRPALLDKSRSSLMVSTQTQKTSNRSNSNSIDLVDDHIKQLMPTLGKQTPNNSNGSIQLSTTETDRRQAQHLGNRNFILAKGSFIDCALQTKLDSTVPGMTACVITRHIYSDNGKVLLIERGSTLSGEYQANIKQGMARIFVLWSRIKIPHGIVINLDSLSTDPLGGSGLPGWIDHHFWQRFGGALMFTLVDDISNYAIQRSNHDRREDQISLDSTGEIVPDLAVETLKNSSNIPPTLHKNQGEQVAIYIARDLDFSSVYDVAITHP